MNINSIITTHHEHAGYSFVEFQGTYFKGCRRCGGTGHYSFNGYDSDCYLCANSSAKLGEELGTLAQAQAWCEGKAKAKAQRDAAAERKRQVEVQALADKVAGVPADVRDFLLGVALNEYDNEVDYESGKKNPAYEKDSFIRSMAEQLQFVTNARRPFSEKMVAAVRANLAKRAAHTAEAEAHPAPEGRVVVTGEIVSAKLVEGDYGTSYKVLVKDDQGFKVWVSLPKAQADEAYEQWFETHPEPYTYGPACWFLGIQGNEGDQGIKGRRITFTATLQPSSDDVSFAFGSRPTKGAWV